MGHGDEKLATVISNKMNITNNRNLIPFVYHCIPRIYLLIHSTNIF